MNCPAHDTYEAARLELMEAAGLAAFYSERIGDFASIGDVEEALRQARNLASNLARINIELHAMADARTKTREAA